MIVGYYLFLGSGDYHAPGHLDKDWVSTWRLQDWKNFVDYLENQLGVNTIFIYLNGHMLPYGSKKYPALIDHHSENVKEDFLIELLEYIKHKGISPIGVLTTTGHAGGFSNLYPENKIEAPQNLQIDEVSYEARLISFPEHIRKGKLRENPGSAQLGFGVLCHNKKEAQTYARTILTEVLDSYGNCLDGVALHPPESVYPCYCEYCMMQFKEEFGKNIQQVSIDKLSLFFVRSYLKFQAEQLIPLVEDHPSSLQAYMFTIPWLFEGNFNHIKQHIPISMTLIDWDYNLDKDRVDKLDERISQYLEHGFKVYFMPTAGFSFNKEYDTASQIEMVHAQIKTASDFGVGGIIHFIGPRLSPWLEETSVHALQQTKSSLTP